MKKVEVLLKAENISKSFPGVKALDNVQLEVYPGEVLALLGENGAGKSTLIKIILGLYKRDSGTIVYQGEEVEFKEPAEALIKGISMIHQEISLVPSLDVAENIWLGREAQFLNHGVLNYKKRYRATEKLLEEMDIHINPKATVASLTIAEMQLVEIVRAISYNPKIIIMDEPTSALTDEEVNVLFRLIRDQTEKGTAVIYISHKMDEIFQIANRAAVFRDGQYIATLNCADTNEQELINMIAGRQMNEMFPKEEAEIGEPLLEVKHLTKKGVFDDISFTVHKGEILGFSGLMGAGRTEIMRAIFGIDQYDSGDIVFDGKKVRFRLPQDAVKSGIGMITEDRLRQGVMHKLSVRQNMVLACLEQINRFFVKPKIEREYCKKEIQDMNISLASEDQAIGTLSGGNQQKVITGKWLLTNPKLLIMNEPTRGIDVGAKAEIHRLISRLAQTGLGIILISSEMAEVMGMSDRLIVLHDGKITFECDRENFPSQEVIMSHAFGLEQ